MFKTEVYKECYPFCREVLYEPQKRDLFVKLLHRREIDLMYIDKNALKQNKKVCQYMRKKVREEKGLIVNLKNHIQNGDFQEVHYSYPNWLIKQYRIILLSNWTATLRLYNGVN